MKYYKAEFVIACDESLLQISRELLADMAGEAGFESFEDTENGVDGYVQMDMLDRQLLDDMITDFPIEDVKVEYNLSCVIDEDWNHEWELAGFEPIDIEGKMLVYDDRNTEAPGTHNIEIGIRARNSFGTGTHATTQMILSELLNIPMEGKRFLDCGCGTGILAIAASKLGASSAVAYDIDEWCVKNTEFNAEQNHIDNITVMEGDVSVLSHISGVFDVVVANINRNILIHDIPAIKEVMNIGATLIISGFYTYDVPMLIECANRNGLELISQKTTDDWAALVLKA